MSKSIYNPLDTGQAFQDIIDSDFNPDIVQVALVDMWGAGYKFGIKCGITIALIGLGSVTIGHKVYKDLKHRFSKNKEES